jgi:hypothetical protein
MADVATGRCDGWYPCGGRRLELFGDFHTRPSLASSCPAPGATISACLSARQSTPSQFDKIAVRNNSRPSPPARREYAASGISVRALYRCYPVVQCVAVSLTWIKHAANAAAGMCLNPGERLAAANGPVRTARRQCRSRATSCAAASGGRFTPPAATGRQTWTDRSPPPPVRAWMRAGGSRSAHRSGRRRGR